MVVFAWGPDRPEYTIEQINDGVLGDKIVFNSIVNNQNIGHEFNFVGARELNKGYRGKNNLWYDTIEVEPNKIYLVRMYVHNNSPLGLDAVAENVTVTFNVPTTIGKEIEVNGFVESSNAIPQMIWDNVLFKSNKDFYLKYLEGSAFFENNGFSNAGVRLSDNIVTVFGTLIGYDKLDGLLPGCFQYAGYITIAVVAEFFDEPIVDDIPTIVEYEITSREVAMLINGDNYGSIFNGDINITYETESSANKFWSMDNPLVYLLFVPIVFIIEEVIRRRLLKKNADKR